MQIYFRCSRQDAETLARQAFRATGKQIKFRLESRDIFSSEPRSNPVFIPVAEEMEGYINFLLDLTPRQALLNVRGEGAPVPFRTADAPDRESPPGLDSLRSHLVSRSARDRHVVREEINKRIGTQQEKQPENFWIPSS